jgi:hypothetical protein
MTHTILLVVPPVVRRQAGDVTIDTFIDTEAETIDGPYISIGRVVDNELSIIVDEVQMTEESSDHFRYLFSPQNLDVYLVWVKVEIDDVEYSQQELLHVDPPWPFHNHNGINSPRIWWSDLLGVPDNVQGIEEGEPVIIEHTDEPSAERDGLREVPIRDRGFAEMDNTRAGQELESRRDPERIVEFEIRSEKEVKEGMLVHVNGRSVPYRVDRVQYLGDSWWQVEAGARRIGGQERDDHRLKKVERY